MKKKLLITSLLGLMLISTVGCSSKEEKEKSYSNDEIYSKIYEANSLDKLLDGHDNVVANCTITDATSEALYSVMYYGDADMVVNRFDYGDVVICTADDEYGLANSGELPYRCLILDEAKADKFKAVRDTFITVYNPTEKVVSQTKANGLLEVETTMNREDTIQAFQYESATWGDFVSLNTVYYVDPVSFVISKMESYLVAEDNNRIQVYTLTVSYDDETYPDAEAIYAQTHGEGRTYTMVANPKTADEKTYSMEIPKGVAASSYLSDEYTTVFIDEECTEPLETSTGNYDDDSISYISTGK